MCDLSPKIGTRPCYNVAKFKKEESLTLPNNSNLPLVKLSRLPTVHITSNH